jgi:hypothetical protein
VANGATRITVLGRSSVDESCILFPSGYRWMLPVRRYGCGFDFS